MKFGLELEGSLFPLWKSYYVDYEGLKILLEELKDSFPYLRLFKMHQLHIENDPEEPFKFLISGVTFQFRDPDSGSKASHTGTLKILSVREREREQVKEKVEDKEGAQWLMVDNESPPVTDAKDDKTGHAPKQVQSKVFASPTESEIFNSVVFGGKFVFDLCSRNVGSNPNSQPSVGNDALRTSDATDLRKEPSESMELISREGTYSNNGDHNEADPTSADVSRTDSQSKKTPTTDSKMDDTTPQTSQLTDSEQKQNNANELKEPIEATPLKHSTSISIDHVADLPKNSSQDNFVTAPGNNNAKGGDGTAYCDLIPPPKHVELFHLDPTNATLLKRSVTTLSAAEVKRANKKDAEDGGGNKAVVKKYGEHADADEANAVTLDNLSVARKLSSGLLSDPQTTKDFNPSVTRRRATSFAVCPPSFAYGGGGGGSTDIADPHMLAILSRMLDVNTVGYSDPQQTANAMSDEDGSYVDADGYDIVSSDQHVIALRQIQRLQQMTLHTRSALGIAHPSDQWSNKNSTSTSSMALQNPRLPKKHRASMATKPSTLPQQIHRDIVLPLPLSEGTDTTTLHNRATAKGAVKAADSTSFISPMMPQSHPVNTAATVITRPRGATIIKQPQDLNSLRLTMHFYIDRKYFSTDADDEDTDNSKRSSHHKVSYCNPSIAHALYAYQRTVSATIAAALQIEIEKVSNFYLSHSHMLCRSALLCIDSVKMWDRLTAHERAQLRTVYRQTYLTFRILQQFCDLNIIAIGKFLKKFDKNLLQNSLENYRTAVDNLNFRMGHNSRITAVQKLMVEKLALHAMNGSNKKAFNFLDTTDESADFNSADRPANSGMRFGKTKVGTLVTLAFMWGIFLSVLTMMILLLAASGARGNSIINSGEFAKKNAEYLIMIPLVMAIPQLLFSINVMIYEHFGINYAFMFELDPIFHWTGIELMRDSLIYLFAWAVCVYVFLRNGYNALNCSEGVDHISPIDGSPDVTPLWAIFPLFLIIWLSIAAYNKWISAEARSFWSAHVFWHIVTTPYFPVKFADFFVCNYFTSMTTSLFELQWYWCTFTTSPGYECTAGRSMSLCILNSLPNIWRMVQSTKRFLSQPKATRKPFPNLVNAGKYLTGTIQPFVWTAWSIAKFKGASPEVLTAMYVLSFASQLVTQSYKLTWDVVVDAGIFVDYGKNGYEWRKERVYKAWWPYYLFIVVDFTFRWRWLMTYYIQLDFKPPWFFAVWAVMELIRRSFWSTFRVENEHVNNTEHYRATKLAPIPVKNIHAWDTFAPDTSPEQFLEKSRRNQFSKEFPSIKGVNLSSVTRFFAALPEKEKLLILTNSPHCKDFFTQSNHQDKKATDAQVGEVAAHKEQQAATGMDLNIRLLTPTVGNESPVIQSEKPTLQGVAGEGKTKFFSELPEEYKILSIVGHLGLETMNAFERRMKSEAAQEKARLRSGQIQYEDEVASNSVSEMQFVTVESSLSK